MDSEFLDVMDKRANDCVALLNALSPEDLEWISANRDYGEDERYRAKDAVDSSLLTSPSVTSERYEIEKCFDHGNLADQYSEYAKRLDQVSGKMHDLLLSACNTSLSGPQSIEDYVNTWALLATIADSDNAHAMYLSSGNWEFSVFNNLIDVMTNWTSDPRIRAVLLTGGVQDIRTSIYSQFGAEYHGLTRQDFLKAVSFRGDWTRPGGTLSIVSFRPATISKGTLSRPKGAEALRSTYQSTVEDLIRMYASEPVAEIARVYSLLHALRCAYDTYEYFGAYAFLRNLLIRRTAQALETKSTSLASGFTYLATTYQYHSAASLIEGAAK
jgi:hypothetical protein